MLLEPSSPAALKVVSDRALGADAPDSAPAADPAAAALTRAREIRLDVAGLRAVVQSLERAVDVAEAAIAAGVTIEDLLRRLRALALEAADTACTADERATLDMAFAALRAELPAQVAAAELYGSNLLASGSPGLEALLDDETGECVRISAEDCSLHGPNLLFSAEDGVADVPSAQVTAGLVGVSLANVERAVARLVLQTRKLQAHGLFVRRLADSLRNGIEVGPVALAEDGRRLHALSDAQRQLGRIEATGTAATLLALFR